jgi:hypothetical protein
MKSLTSIIHIRIDSRLLILTGAPEDPGANQSFHDSPCGIRYYVWRRNRLNLVHEVLAAP